ncbi:MAG: glycoside hydrolase family 127 protein [Armatimonadota bacterium]
MKLQPVPFTHVKIKDKFWSPRMETNRTVTVPHSLDMLEKTGSIHNLELAAQGARDGFVGPPWTDSDVYKAIEAASYTLANTPDPLLEKRLDAIIEKIAAAQCDDGYLNSYYQVNAPDKRWTDLSGMHELYCAGHLFEAATAYFNITGKRTLLDVATRYADYIDSVFGSAPGKRMGYCGHPEIELALMKLWKVTGENRYFRLAEFFIESRGRGFLKTENSPLKVDPEYFQDNVPIREHDKIVGHAVRAGYLFSGVTDIARETNDQGMLDMLDRVWKNTTQKRTYITGGIGPSASNEGFTKDYDLPNMTAYQETCASVAMAMWNHRMGLLYGDSRYFDYVETALYNGILAGVSLDGKKFFYDNPLSSNGSKERVDWFGCCCCPPNVSRTIAMVGDYAYAQSDDTLWINQYIQSDVDVSMRNKNIRMSVKTDYPWDGKVQIRVSPPSSSEFALKLRIPGWCHAPSIKVNGEKINSLQTDRGYAVIKRTWISGDKVILDLPMDIQKVKTHPKVKDDAGMLEIQRGPVVYCLEGIDQSVELNNIGLSLGTKLKAERKTGQLGDIVSIKGKGIIEPEQDWSGVLYQKATPYEQIDITAIPYALWANRGPSTMKVWIPTIPPAVSSDNVKISASFQSNLSNLAAIHDGTVPEKSSVRTTDLFHWWPNKGGLEWVQYDWKKPVTVTGSNVYWFDDTGIGECRLPISWRILYKDGNDWKPVDMESEYPIVLDSWSSVKFKPVTTSSLRLETQLGSGVSTGIHEWEPVILD